VESPGPVSFDTAPRRDVGLTASVEKLFDKLGVRIRRGFSE